MSDDSVRWLVDKPNLRDPILVVMLDGWIDAGGAARSAITAIEQDAGASPIAELDDDAYADFRARRPMMELREGLNTALIWERLRLSVGRDRTGRDLLTLTGPEPDIGWRRFTSTIGDIASDLGVSMLAHLGAYPFAVPHTRPSRLSVSSPSHDILMRVPFLRSSIDVPAGISASLEHEMHARSIPSLGIWAQVPHYVSTLPYPAASAALLDGLREATGVVIDAPALRQQVLVHRTRIDEMIAGNDEHAKMVAQLEEFYDTSADRVDVEIAAPTLEMRTAEELAGEFEKYLREQG